MVDIFILSTAMYNAEVTIFDVSLHDYMKIVANAAAGGTNVK